MAQSVLLIDDDTRLTMMVSHYLQQSGFKTDSVSSLEMARQYLSKTSTTVDAVILDLMLPDGDGLDFCRYLRMDSKFQTTPILMLTARGEPMDRVVGLELGADDYLAKPFEPRELLARLRAILRRSNTGQSQQASAGEVLRFGDLDIDLGSHKARLEGLGDCDLTSYQFQILVVLAQQPGRVLSRDQIMDALKGHALEAFDRSIDVHISRIRAAIEKDPKNPRRILTVRGAGYVFVKKQD